jgi:sulfate adenylyltransferase
VSRSASWRLTPRQLCDLELLGCGAFAPLRGYLGRADCESVCESMRLTDGTLWPIPIMLDVPAEVVAAARDGRLALRDPAGALLAVLEVHEAWRPDRSVEAARVFGTTDVHHPGVATLLRDSCEYYVSGHLDVVALPAHTDFRHLRYTPAQLRAELRRRGWQRVVAFQTRNPMHRAHQQLTIRAARDADAHVLLHPVVGLGKPGDIDSATRVRCYEAMLREYAEGTAMLALLPLAMRMAGPREALWHAIIRRNYGATHFIVGRDHAGPGRDAAGRSFYEPYAAQELLREHRDELGIEILSYRHLVYLPDDDAYVPEEEAPAGVRTWSISGTELRERLRRGERLPHWLTPPSVAAALHG